MTKSQQGRPAQPSYQDTLDGVIRHLDATDEATVAVALATLSILLTQSNEEANLKGLVPRLLELLSAGGSQVKVLLAAGCVLLSRMALLLAWEHSKVRRGGT